MGSDGEPGISTTPMGPRASFLSIESVGHRHSGEYTCVARNKAGNASYSAYLKVNGKEGTLKGRKRSQFRAIKYLHGIQNKLKITLIKTVTNSKKTNCKNRALIGLYLISQSQY